MAHLRERAGREPLSRPHEPLTATAAPPLTFGRQLQPRHRSSPLGGGSSLKSRCRKGDRTMWSCLSGKRVDFAGIATGCGSDRQPSGPRPAASGQAGLGRAAKAGRAIERDPSPQGEGAAQERLPPTMRLPYQGARTTTGNGMATSQETADIRLRIMLAPGTPLGPGKAQLLQGIKETGSISAAGRRMGMSYKRAWYLVEALNGHFDAPMVEATKGGRAG